MTQIIYLGPLPCGHVLRRSRRAWAINRQRLRQTGGVMGAGHVPELGGDVQDPAPGSTHVGGLRVLTQREVGGKGMRAAEAAVVGMFPP